MSTYWETRFETMAQPPSATEQVKCDNAERILKSAIEESSLFSGKLTKTILQGSYRNNTNVRQESDVDIALVCSNTLYWNYIPQSVYEASGFGPIVYDYPTYKQQVGQALVDKFGYASVERGKKAFDIKANTYRVDADVAPFFEYRHYLENGSYIEGVAMYPDNSAELLINWPDLHYRNGVTKNENTSRRYKRVVRILKSLRYELKEQGIISADNLIGFTLECLAWNAPDSCYQSPLLYENVKAVIEDVYARTKSEIEWPMLLEVSCMKKLYGPHQKWSRQGVITFLENVYTHIT